MFSAGDHKGIYFSDKRRLKIVIHRKIGVLNDYFSISLSFTMLISRAPTLVIVHGLQHYSTLISLIVYGLLKRKPTLILVHGIYEASNAVELLRDRFIKFLLKLLDKSNPRCSLLALTRYDKENLTRRWGLSDDRVFVSFFPLFMSTDEIRALSCAESATMRDSGNRCTFLYIGRLSPEKEIDKIIFAFDKVVKRGYEARLTIIGGGPLEQQITSLVRKLGLNDRVNIPGIVWGDKKWNFYNESDALVLASKHEGLPRVILEAFAAGKSVVVPRISGIPELVTHELNGFLFENEEELVDVMSRIAEKIDLFRNNAKVNKKTVMDQMILETRGLEDFIRIVSQIGICL